MDNEAFHIISGNCANNARADIAIRDFNGIHNMTYIDISVASPVCDSYKELSVIKVIANTEKRKNDNYLERIKKTIGRRFHAMCFY